MLEAGIVLLICLLALAIYHLWSRSGRGLEEVPPDLYLQETAEYGADVGHGNLLGIQPFMVSADYASEARFYAKMDGYLDAARRKGWLNEKTIVVLPEYVGTWLAAAGEKRSVHQAVSIQSAMATLILSNLFSFFKALLSAPAKDKIRYSLFRMKAAEMARMYESIFSRLAREYGVTVVAGSILLPSPRIAEGRLTVGDGELYNVSAVYRPDGSVYESLVRKVYPTQDELPFVRPAAVEELPVLDTPAGRLGVLICADSWYPSPYEVLAKKGAEIVVVPSYLSPDGVWQELWRGYNGAPAPADVDPHDAESLTEGQAWLKYALAGRLSKAGIKQGINVFLRGKLWDLGSAGHTILVREGAVSEASDVDGAALHCSWLA